MSIRMSDAARQRLTALAAALFLVPALAACGEGGAGEGLYEGSATGASVQE